MGGLVWVWCGSWAAWLTWKEPVQGSRKLEFRSDGSCLVVIQDEVPGEVVIVLTVDNARAWKPNGAFIPDPRDHVLPMCRCLWPILSDLLGRGSLHPARLDGKSGPKSLSSELRTWPGTWDPGLWYLPILFSGYLAPSSSPLALGHGSFFL